MKDLISIADTKHTLALQQHAQHAAGAYSKNTEAAIRSDTAIWSAWCSDHGHVPLPAAPAALVAFVDDMARARAVACHLPATVLVTLAVNKAFPCKQ